MKIVQPDLIQVQTVVGSIFLCLENERLEIIMNINVTQNIQYQFNSDTF